MSSHTMEQTTQSRSDEGMRKLRWEQHLNQIKCDSFGIMIDI